MLAPKSIALLIAGVIIISAVFSVFQVTYPTGNPVIHPKVPQKYQLFKYQFNDKNLLGNGTTTFNPSANGTVTIEGYVHNASSLNNSPIGNAYLYAAVFPVESNYLTTASGFYKITVIKYGQGTFAFQIPGFNEKLVKMSLLGSSIYWLNLSLDPAQKYTISGSTVDVSGHSIPSAQLVFNDFIQNYQVAASNNGEYSVSLYNGTYGIASSTPGFSSLTTPDIVVVNGAAKSGFNITLKQLSTPTFYVSGYVHNLLGKPITGAVVTSLQIKNDSSTNSSGYYQIKVPAGLNYIVATATGYSPNYTTRFVSTNLTDVNFTLTNNNPFGNSGQNSINGTGTSGLPPGVVKNITGALGNRTSKVNYGNNTTSGTGSGILLQGNVTDANNSAPVVDTYLYFYVDVNGTYYYNGVKTNGTGHYSIVVAHPGHYYFYVYNPMYENYSFGMWINSSSKKSFSLTPNQGYTHLLSGQVTNSLDSAGMPSNVTVYALGTTTNPILQFQSNSTGYYHGYLIQGNYSLYATSNGFTGEWNNSSVKPLIKDETVNFNLIPVSTLGSSTTLWNSGSQTGIPGVSSSNVSSQLSNSTGGNTLANGSSPIYLTIKMVNSSGNNTLSNMQYSLFIKLNTLFYVHNGTTNSSGVTVVPLGYEGNYSLLVESVYYFSKVVSLNITGDTSLTMYLQPRPVFKLSVTLVNSYNSTNGGKVTVPLDYLNITNYKQTLNITSANLITGTGTMVNYSLPDGNYSFTYSNVHYVTHSFYSNISGSSNSTVQKVKPYMVIVNSVSSASFTYSISSLTGTEAVIAGSPYKVYFAGENGVLYFFQADLGNQAIYPKSFTLNRSSPVSIIYLNITSNTLTGQLGNLNQSEKSNNVYTIEVPYTYLVGAIGYIYRMSVNYTIGHNPQLFLNGQNYTEPGQTGSTFYFSTYYDYLGGTLNILTVSQYDGFNAYYLALPSIHSSAVTVYYYVPMLSYVTSGGN